jgi:LAO/AO transport system kinase
MLVAAPSAGRSGPADADRPRPKRPEVVLATATTGDGVPDLLGALDRRRSEADDAARAAGRLTRAEAQVWAVVGDRLRARLLSAEDGAGARQVLDDVAEHRLDPFSAADQLIARLGEGQ